jgi:hypothetical protein
MITKPLPKQMGQVIDDLLVRDMMTATNSIILFSESVKDKTPTEITIADINTWT